MPLSIQDVVIRKMISMKIYLLSFVFTNVSLWNHDMEGTECTDEVIEEECNNKYNIQVCAHAWDRHHVQWDD